MGTGDVPQWYVELLKLVHCSAHGDVVVRWADDQSMGDIGAPGSHCWCNLLLCAARHVL
jgi:hypothetical protein